VNETQLSRRKLLTRGGMALAATVLSRPVWAKDEKDESAEGISPPEDLMREHGVLNRILLIYEETLRRMDAGETMPHEPLRASAQLVREFVEDYHERLEEKHVFPRFRKAKKLVSLVDVLLEQHRAGRQLTDTTIRLATAKGLENQDDRRELADTLRQFIRMYRPHEAREDTVLFPAFRTVVSESEFASLGEEFEREEDELFGDEGFFKVVDRVANIERDLGIHELSKFTPTFVPRRKSAPQKQKN
jgi:hemerythrin-like domain-containing protein